MRDRFLQWLVWLALRAPGPVLLVAALATAVAFRAGGTVQLRSSQLDMIPKDNPVVHQWIAFTEDFDILADLYVVVRATPETLDRAKAFAADLEKALAKHPSYVQDTEYRLDPSLYANQELYFLRLDQVRDITEGVKERRGNLLSLARDASFETLISVFETELAREEPADPEETREFFEFVGRVSRRIETAALGQSPEEIPWRGFFGAGPLEDESRDDPFADGGWKLSRSGDAILMAVHPANSTDEHDFVLPFFETCRREVDSVRTLYPDLEVGLAGQPALTYSQKDTVEKDLGTTSMVSLAGVSAVFVWGFRGLGLPLLAIVSLVCAVTLTFGTIAVTPGHLNLMTTAFISLLLGLGVDYGIYVVSQFADRRRAGDAVPDAVRQAVRSAGPGILTGGLTASAGFLTLKLTDFPGFQELGQISAVGLLLCMTSMLVLLPALLGLSGRVSHSLGTGHTGRIGKALGRLAALTLRAPLAVVLVFVCGAMLLGVEGMGVEFDYNIQNLEPKGTEAVEYERVMQEEFEITPDTNMVVARDLDEARRLKAELHDQSSVGDVDSFTSYIPADPEEKRRLLEGAAGDIQDIRFEVSREVDVGGLAEALERVAARLRELKLPLLFSSAPEVVIEGDASERAARNAAGTLKALPRDLAGRRLATFQVRSFQDLADGFEGFRRMVLAEPFSPDSLPPSIVDRYRGNSGRWVLFVSPRVNVRIESQARQFISQTRFVAPDATGVPILVDEVLVLLRRGFVQATIYSITAVALLVFLDFRNPRRTLMALTPLVVSLAATVGLMKLSGLKYNPANFVSIPILTGLGMAYGVYVLHRLHQQPEAGVIGAIESTGKSVLLSCLTSMVALGSLGLADNRGLSSLGQIILMGLAVCLLTVLLMLPPLAELLGYRDRHGRGAGGGVLDRLLSTRL